MEERNRAVVGASEDFLPHHCMLSRARMKLHIYVTDQFDTNPQKMQGMRQSNGGYMSSLAGRAVIAARCHAVLGEYSYRALTEFTEEYPPEHRQEARDMHQDAFGNHPITQTQRIVDAIGEVARHLADVKNLLHQRTHGAAIARNLDSCMVWVNRQQAADIAGVTMETISNWVSEGNIRTRPHGTNKYDRVSIERFIASGIPQGEDAASRKKSRKKRR